MKKILSTLAVLAGAVVTIYAQGQISIGNDANVNTSPTATSGGLFFQNVGGVVSLLTSGTINVQVNGGASAGSMSTIAVLTGVNALSYNFSPGTFADFNGTTYAVTGVALNGTATLEIYAWLGNFASYAAAVSGGAYTAYSGPFSNATGGGGNPPATPAGLVGMPAMILAVPEPATIALLGLGAASLLIFRRRK
jgi:hypothetical protein